VRLEWELKMRVEDGVVVGVEAGVRFSVRVAVGVEAGVGGFMAFCPLFPS
jgi:hypothetical protein